jgi:glucokinase
LSLKYNDFMLILSGDVGGTMTRIQLTEFRSSDESKILKIARYKSSYYANLIEIIDLFLRVLI